MEYFVKTLDEEEDKGIYTRQERLHMVEDDIIDPWEEGFMDGYDNSGLDG